MSDQGNLFGSTPHGTFVPPEPPNALEIERLRILDERRQPNGTICGACGQRAAERKRSINATMARGLRRQFLNHGLEWGKHTDGLTRRQAGDYAKLAAWGLVELLTPGKRPAYEGDMRGRSRVTTEGREYIYGRLAVVRQIIFYNQEVVGVVDASKVATVAQVRNLDHDEYMAGVPPYDDVAP